MLSSNGVEHGLALQMMWCFLPVLCLAVSGPINNCPLLFASKVVKQIAPRNIPLQNDKTGVAHCRKAENPAWRLHYVVTNPKWHERLEKHDRSVCDSRTKWPLTT